MRVVDTSTSQGCSFCIRSLFGALDTLSERSMQGLQLLCEQHLTLFHVAPRFPKKSHLGSQNGFKSLGLEKLLKIVNYQNCQKTVLSQLEKVDGHRYPPGLVILVERYGW